MSKNGNLWNVHICKKFPALHCRTGAIFSDKNARQRRALSKFASGFLIPLCIFFDFWLKKGGSGKNGKEVQKRGGKYDQGVPKGDDRDANAGQHTVWKRVFHFEAPKSAAKQAGYGGWSKSHHWCGQRLSCGQAKKRATAVAVCIGLCLRCFACRFLYTFIIYLTRIIIWCIIKWIRLLGACSRPPPDAGMRYARFQGGFVDISHNGTCKNKKRRFYAKSQKR